MTLRSRVGEGCRNGREKETGQDAEKGIDGNEDARAKGKVHTMVSHPAPEHP
jgi:hypothetical protein